MFRQLRQFALWEAPDRYCNPTKIVFLLEEELSDLELEEPMEVDYDSYDMYDLEHDAWDQHMEELKDELEELEAEIEART